MIDLEYKIACTEVLEILKYISKEDYDKIPKDIIEAMEKNKEKEHKFKYNIRKPFNDQNITKKSKTILAIFFRDYWATEKQREMILLKEKSDREKAEQSKREKYNPDDIFKNNTIDKEESTDEIKDENVQMIEDKEENIISRIINKIRSFFGKY